MTPVNSPAAGCLGDRETTSSVKMAGWESWTCAIENSSQERWPSWRIVQTIPPPPARGARRGATSTSSTVRRTAGPNRTTPSGRVISYRLPTAGHSRATGARRGRHNTAQRRRARWRQVFSWPRRLICGWFTGRGSSVAFVRSVFISPLILSFLLFFFFFFFCLFLVFILFYFIFSTKKSHFVLQLDGFWNSQSGFSLFLVVTFSVNPEATFSARFPFFFIFCTFYNMKCSFFTSKSWSYYSIHGISVYNGMRL